MSIQYLLDEHIPPLYRTQIVRRESSLIVRIIGAPEPKHLEDHLTEGRHIPGIFVIDPTQSIGQIIEELLIIAGASNDDEYQDRIEYLPLT